MSESRLSDRLKDFKKGIDPEDSRRRREVLQLNIRKQKKGDRLTKRRNQSATTDANEALPISEGKVYTTADLPMLVQTIANLEGTQESLIEATCAIRRILSVSTNPPVKEVVAVGALPHLVRLLMRTDCHLLQFEASWALTNVASTSYTKSVADQPNAIKFLVDLLRSPDGDVREQCAWCLGNIAGEGPEFRDKVLRQGALDSLILNIQEPASDSLLGNVTWTVSNLCRGKPQPVLAMIQPAIPALCYLATHCPNDDIVADALWALSYVSDGNDDRLSAILQCDINLPRCLIEHIKSDKAALCAPAVRILGNFVSGNEEQTQAVIDAGIINVALRVLNSSKRNLRKEMCWLLSNIAAGTQDQIGVIVQERPVADVLVNYAMEAEWETRKEAIWAVSNIFTGGTEQHVQSLVTLNGITAMTTVLDIPGENRMVLVALDAIENILSLSEKKGFNYPLVFDEAGGIDKLEELQTHDDHTIYEKAVQLIDRFFGEEEAEDENLVPRYDGDTFAFGMESPPPAKNLFDGPVSSPIFSFGGSGNFNFGS